MNQIFPKWVNKVPFVLAAIGGITGALATGFVWYYFSPSYTDVGFRPVQPVEFSHKLHAGDLGMDCRYCHSGVEKSAVAGVPPTQTCMGCHTLIQPESDKLLPVRESWASGIPIQWARVHKVPDYAYFNHSVHIRAGVGCESCHGNMNEVDVAMQQEPLSMGWCLECHRNPDQHLRSPDQITQMEWQPGELHADFVRQWKAHKGIKKIEDCSSCHR